MIKNFMIRPGTPDDENRHYLPESLIKTDIVVNESGNNSQPWPKRLQRFEDVIADGKKDVWYEYVPESYDGKDKVPLVVSLHGGLMTGWGQCVYSSWSMLADREGFIVVYPDASEMQFWSIEGIYESGAPTELDGHFVPRPPEDYRELHDLNFVKGLIEKTIEKYNIDTERIFMQGMSMGNMMTAQFARYYGYMLAGAAGSGANTWPHVMFNEDGTVKNVGGPVPAWQSRPENNGFPGPLENGIASNAFNRYYWLKVNECDPIPEISIVGDNNFAFYKGQKADYVFLDIKNRDHGQALEEAFLYWDYFFSGLRRLKDGTVKQSQTLLPRQGDKIAAAFSDNVNKAWWHNNIQTLSTTPVKWQKLKYHGLNGGQVVRGEYTMVPADFLAEMAGAEYKESEDTLSAMITLQDGRQVYFVRGSIVCQIDDEVRCMYVEAIHRDGRLLVSAEWFAEMVLGFKVSKCNGVTYITDHEAHLSYYMADLIKRILKGETGDSFEIQSLKEKWYQ